MTQLQILRARLMLALYSIRMQAKINSLTPYLYLVNGLALFVGKPLLFLGLAFFKAALLCDRPAQIYHAYIHRTYGEYERLDRLRNPNKYLGT